MTLVKKLITKGNLKYSYFYNVTTTSADVIHHIADVPYVLKNLAKKHPAAKVVTYNDYTLGIDVGDKVFAVEDPVPLFRIGKKLKNEVWEYIILALGHHPTPGWMDPVTD